MRIETILIFALKNGCAIIFLKNWKKYDNDSSGTQCNSKK